TVASASSVKPGLRTSVRTPKRMSCAMDSGPLPFLMEPPRRFDGIDRPLDKEWRRGGWKRRDGFVRRGRRLPPRDAQPTFVAAFCRRTGMRYDWRGLLLAVLLFGMVGIGIELLLLEHTEEFWQWLPIVLLGIGIVGALALAVRPSRVTVRTFQTIMLLFLAAGAL